MSLIGQPLVKKNRELMGLKSVDWCLLICGPPAYPPLRESSGDEPEPARVIAQHFERRAAAVPENIERTGERICGQRLLTERRQTVNTVTEINGIDGEENPELRNQLNHGGDFRSARNRRRGD